MYTYRFSNIYILICIHTHAGHLIKDFFFQSKTAFDFSEFFSINVNTALFAICLWKKITSIAQKYLFGGYSKCQGNFCD